MKKKLLFWLTGDMTQFHLSYYMQNADKFDFYAIIDSPYHSKEFYQQQKLVKFKKIWYLHDFIKKKKSNPDFSFLTNFEKKYNLDLWKLIINERIFYRFFNFHKFSYEEVLSIDEQMCKFFESILDEVKPLAFITKLTGFHHLEIFCQMCRSQNIKVMMPYIGKFSNRLLLTDNPIRIDSDFDINEVSGLNRDFKQLRDLLKSHDSAGIVDKFINNLGSSKINFIKSAFRYLFLSNNKSEKILFAYYGRTKIKVLTYMLKSILTRKIRKIFIDNNLELDPKLNLKFVYFALGVDLERNILLDSPYFTNQVEVIRNIAKSLPIDFKLYVKEAPANVTRDWRSKSEYNDILKIPNVTLIHPNYDSKNLLENCSLVATIAGSSGFEATFYGKASIVFSDVLYDSLPSVFKIKTPEYLPKIIRQALECKVQASDLDKFIVFLEKNSINFDLYAYETKQLDLFAYGGQYLDVPISEEKVKSFLEEDKLLIKNFVDAHLEKIQKFEEKQ
jgi:hypothetical protein